MNQPIVQDKNNLLHLACEQVVGLPITQNLIQLGIPINAQNGYTPLHFACWKESDDDVIQLLLVSGAETNIANNKRPEDLTINQKKKELIAGFNGITGDMLHLFEEDDNQDITINCIDGKIQAHSLILQVRFGENYHKALQIFRLKKKELIESFLRVIYSGFIHNKEQFDAIQALGNEIGIDISSKIGRNGVVKDLKILYNQEETKDFTIIVQTKKFRIHKLILIARSELYRGMFLLNKNDTSNEVNDYSEKSAIVIQALIQYLYTDELPDDIPKELVPELEDIVDYYQLNPNSSFNFQLEKYKMKYNLNDLNTNQENTQFTQQQNQNHDQFISESKKDDRSLCMIL
ncbi:hypothetical protein M0811_01181 [Anaeramoeba ignava]|uniref:BTB domain-containing protein n=1 Tax=Anaeramoeba ignava TaxID=1746090 RepID=A0A9Q0LML1_ANAIG|nr:hypothetical protein M0811_01181 [Anaeramoeba ignava]